MVTNFFGRSGLGTNSEEEIPLAHFGTDVGQGVRPHFHLFAKLLTTLINQLKEVSDVLEIGMLRSYISRSFFETKGILVNE
jgi:hypothetical protein